LLTVASTTLPPSASSVPAARRLVHSVSAHLPRRAQEAAELVASELATNSVIHAGTSFEVFAAADDDTVEVLVADRAGWAKSTTSNSGTGHGLLLVGLLASEWAAQIDGPGKHVWARVCVDDVPAW